MRTLKSGLFLIAALVGVLLMGGTEPGFSCNPGCPSRWDGYWGWVDGERLQPHRTATWTPDGNRLVFGFHNGLYSVDPDGSNLRRLFAEQQSTAHGGDFLNFDNSPTISRNDDVMAFATLRHVNTERHLTDDSGPRQSEIILSTTNGSSYERLSFSEEEELHPSLSPDGSLLAFTSFLRGTTEAVYFMSLETDRQPVRLTPPDVSVKEGGPLRWSHDGQFIAFYAWIDGRTGLHTVDVSTKDIHYIAEDRPLFAWSPVENRIAFFELEFRVHGTYDKGSIHGPIYTARPDGSDRQAFHSPELLQFADATSIWWAPDGNEVRVFGVRYHGFDGRGSAITTAGLFAIFPDGREPRVMAEMTQLATIVGHATTSWSPDGSQIALMTHSDYGHEGDVLWITDSNLENKRVLVTSASDGTNRCGAPDYKLSGADGKEAIE